MTLRSILRATAFLPLLSGITLAAADVSAAHDDVQLRAMSDELQRSKLLQVPGLDKPYFIRYAIADAENVAVSASLGGLLSSHAGHHRQPAVEVRVGTYAFDNTNSVFSVQPGAGAAAIDSNYLALRDTFWLITDAFYKSNAIRLIGKRNALREIQTPDPTPDFAPAQPVTVLQPAAKAAASQRALEDEARRLSERFKQHPDVLGSAVQIAVSANTFRIVTSEGSVVRTPQPLATVQVETNALAADGRNVRDSYLIAGLNESDLPPENQLAGAVDALAQETEALRKAQLVEDYNGPVLFEQQAAAQLMAALMTDAARLTRRPVAPPEANTPVALDSVWASRVGSSVTPAWMSIEDDPLQAVAAGVPLAGHYEVDDEAVPAERVSIVDKGVLKGFLLSREPVRTWNRSNGHGRLPGPFQTEQAVIGNLFVKVDKPLSETQLRKKLLERVKASGLQYGLIVRKIDFPSTVSGAELQSLGKQAQKAGYSRTAPPPLAVYRVFPDGREELVRGARFGEVSAKDLRDVVAASDRPYVLNYVNHGTSFDFVAAGGSATLSSVICPSLLFESVDVQRAEEEVKKLPIVPAPGIDPQN